jgi:hypothetical protein
MCDEPVREPEFIEHEIVEDIPDPARQPLLVEPHEVPPQEDDQPVREEQLSTLSDMQRDGFVFFTPVLISTHGLFDRDPIIEFSRTHTTNDEAERPFYVDCAYPFFQDLGKSLVREQLIDWDHRLYGIHESQWESLRDFVGSIAIYDANRYHYAKVGYHNLRIVDPTTLHSGQVMLSLPTLDIWVFFVSTYRYFAYLAPAVDPPRTRPYVKMEPPKPEIKAEAESILGPPPAPEQLALYQRRREG